MNTLWNKRWLAILVIALLVIGFLLMQFADAVAGWVTPGGSVIPENLATNIRQTGAVIVAACVGVLALAVLPIWAAVVVLVVLVVAVGFILNSIWKPSKPKA